MVKNNLKIKIEVFDITVKEYSEFMVDFDKLMEKYVNLKMWISDTLKKEVIND